MSGGFFLSCQFNQANRHMASGPLWRWCATHLIVPLICLTPHYPVEICGRGQFLILDVRTRSLLGRLSSLDRVAIYADLPHFIFTGTSLPPSIKASGVRHNTSDDC